MSKVQSPKLPAGRRRSRGGALRDVHDLTPHTCLWTSDFGLPLPFARTTRAPYLGAMTAAPTNRLAREKSPYLLQHAHNPVDWFSWGDEAFARARAENKPIFLSVGYSTCHWCHVMERESFEDESVAAFLNEHFVSIKVDREERPD